MHDLVTEIREERGAYRVTVNDTETFRLSAADYQALPLVVGQALDWPAYRAALLKRQYPEALAKAVALLAARARSRREVARKLADRGYRPETVAQVIARLQGEGLLDDAAFAAQWAQARAAKGLGRARLLQELRLKGIAEDVCQTALAGLDTDAQDEQAARLAEKLLARYGRLPAREAMQKALAAFQRRGYGYGEASRALQAALERMRGEE